MSSGYSAAVAADINGDGDMDVVGGHTTTDSPVVLVTHQVTITAITGVYPASGEGVLIDRADAQQRYAAKARFLFEE